MLVVKPLSLSSPSSVSPVPVLVVVHCLSLSSVSPQLLASSSCIVIIVTAAQCAWRHRHHRHLRRGIVVVTSAMLEQTCCCHCCLCPFLFFVKVWVQQQEDAELQASLPNSRDGDDAEIARAGIQVFASGWHHARASEILPWSQKPDHES